MPKWGKTNKKSNKIKSLYQSQSETYFLRCDRPAVWIGKEFLPVGGGKNILNCLKTQQC